ncbi:MAG: Bug family tripartite tricarboxylate transporter substrate binding protein [Gemmatimonas sp.]
MMKNTGTVTRVGLLFAAAMAVGISATAARADDFYRGKTINVYVGYASGGGYDIYARMLARSFGRFVPGNPNIVVQNRPGAGSIRLANELYNGIHPTDGTAIGIIGDVLHIKQVLGEAGIKFEATKFNWIGRLADTDPVLVVRADAPATTVEDAKRKEVLIGVPGAGSATAQTLAVINNVLGTKFKLITGYPGSSDIRLAVERGEVHGSGSVLWSVSKDWIRQNNLKILYQVTPTKYADLPDPPRLIDLAPDEETRQLLRFFASYTEMGRSFLAPPAVPTDRVQTLRDAFAKMVADPAFVADSRKETLELGLNPLTGEQLQQLVVDVSRLPPKLLDRAVAVSKAVAAENPQKSD